MESLGQGTREEDEETQKQVMFYTSLALSNAGSDGVQNPARASLTR